MPTRGCPPSYGGECGERPCARYESEDETPWRARYPDHREGVQGIDRADSAVNLDDTTLMLVLGIAKLLRSSVLVGRQAPIVERIWARMEKPQIGDLVVEYTALSPRERPIEDRYRGFGYLLARRTEWADSAAEWAQFERDEPDNATEDNRATNEAWYVQYGPKAADVCRWTNCDFIALPGTLEEAMTWTT